MTPNLDGPCVRVGNLAVRLTPAERRVLNGEPVKSRYVTLHKLRRKLGSVGVVVRAETILILETTDA